MKILLLLFLLVGCSAPPEEKPIKHQVVNTVVFKRYALSESEHIFVIDVDDKYVPRRCVIFVNEATKTSSPLNCNLDDAGTAMPEGNVE